MDITLTAKKIREESYYERGFLIKMTAHGIHSADKGERESRDRGTYTEHT